MSKTYICPIEVRGYELDSYRHVNHAVYLNYFEHARWKLLEEEGVTLPKFDSWKCWPVIAHVEVTYLRPVFMLDRLEVHTTIREFSRGSIYFEQDLKRDGQTVTRAVVRNVMVGENGRPVQMPTELAAKWETP